MQPRNGEAEVVREHVEREAERIGVVVGVEDVTFQRGDEEVKLVEL